MFESEEGPPQSGGRATGVDEDIQTTGDEGARTAATSPPIADDGRKGQTQTQAPAEDVGVPPDDEMNAPDA